MIKKIITTLILTMFLASCSTPDEDTVVVLDEREALSLDTVVEKVKNEEKIIRFNIFNDSNNALKAITGKLMGITINNKGEIFILDQDMHKLIKFSPKGDFIAEFGSEGSEENEFKEPKYILARDNLIYIGDTWNNRIKIVNKDGEVENFIYSSFFGPKGISIYNNKTYIADTGNHQIKVFNDNNELIKTISSKGNKENELHEPTGLAHDDKGNLYIVDSRNNRICVYNSNDEFDYCWKIARWKKDTGGKESWIIAYKDKIYLSDPVKCSVIVFSKDGKELNSIITNLKSISGITIKDNKIFAIDYASGEVIVKDINGN